jgi:hypothetical protein
LSALIPLKNLTVENQIFWWLGTDKSLQNKKDIIFFLKDCASNQVFLKNSKGEYLTSTCRACLSDCTNDYQKIKCFSSTHPLTGITLNELYNDLVGFRYEEAESKLPTGICQKCEQILMEFSDFREQCHANEQEHLARLNEIGEELKDDQPVGLNIESMEDYEFEVLEEFDLKTENNDSIMLEYSVEPPTASTEMTTLTEIAPEEKFDQDHQKFIVNEFQCDVCKKVYNKKEFLISHLKLIHQQKVLKRPGSFADFSCTLCGMFFKKKFLLSSHLKYVHGKASEHVQVDQKRRKVVKVRIDLIIKKCGALFPGPHRMSLFTIFCVFF